MSSYILQSDFIPSWSNLFINSINVKTSSSFTDVLFNSLTGSDLLVNELTVNNLYVSDSINTTSLVADLLFVDSIVASSVDYTSVLFDSLSGSDTTTHTVTVTGVSNVTTVNASDLDTHTLDVFGISNQTTINASDIITNNLTVDGNFTADVYSNSLQSSDKGDLLVGDATDHFDIFPIGTVDQVLTVSSDNNLLWVTPTSDTTTAINVGTNGQNVFASDNNGELQFRKIDSSDSSLNVTISANDEVDLQINEVYSSVMQTSDKGDLLVGNATNGTFDLFPIGTVDQVLTVSSDNNLAWTSNPDLTSAINVGVNGQNVFASDNNGELQFRKIDSSDSSINVTISANDEVDLQINEVYSSVIQTSDKGDLLVGNATNGTFDVFSIGSVDQVLTVSSDNNLAWNAVSTTVTSTDIQSSDQGDLLLGDASGTFEILPLSATAGDVLTASSDNTAKWEANEAKIDTTASFTLGNYYSTVTYQSGFGTLREIGTQRVITSTKEIWVRESSDSVLFELEDNSAADQNMQIARINHDEDKIVSGLLAGTGDYLSRSGSNWSRVIGVSLAQGLGGNSMADMAINKGNAEHIVSVADTGGNPADNSAGYQVFNDVTDSFFHQFTWNDGDFSDGFNPVSASKVAIDDDSSRCFLGSGDRNATNGQVYAYLRTGASDWSQEHYFTPSAGFTRFGKGLFCNSDASELLIFSDNDSNLLAIDKYTRSSTTWTLKWHETFSVNIDASPDSTRGFGDPSITDDWSRIVVPLTQSDNGTYFVNKYFRHNGNGSSDGYEIYENSTEDTLQSGRISRDGKYMLSTDSSILAFSSFNRTAGTNDYLREFSSGDIILDQFGNLKTVF